MSTKAPTTPILGKQEDAQAIQRRRQKKLRARASFPTYSSPAAAQARPAYNNHGFTPYAGTLLPPSFPAGTFAEERREGGRSTVVAQAKKRMRKNPLPPPPPTSGDIQLSFSLLLEGEVAAVLGTVPKEGPHVGCSFL